MPRPSNYVRDKNGVEVHGLSRVAYRRNSRGDITQWRYFTTVGSGRKAKKQWFGTDEQQAIFEYRRWAARNRAPDLQDQLWDELSKQAQLQMDGFGRDPRLASPLARRLYDELSRQSLAVSVADWIRDDFQGFRKAVLVASGIDLCLAGPVEDDATLEEIGKLYHDKGGLTNHRWKRDSQSFWAQFCELIGGKRQKLREIDQQKINHYHDEIMGMFRRGEQSRTYVSHRFGQVKTIINFARKRGKNRTEAVRILNDCAVLNPPPKREAEAYGKAVSRPQDIAPADFRKLLAASDEKWRAVFLMAMNCALYPSEVAAVLTGEINLDSKVFVTDRRKTGITRIAVLWDRTTAAIRAYRQKHPHQAEYLFINQVGKPYNANHVCRNFRRRLADAGFPKEAIKFEHFRDSAQTIAIQGGAPYEQAKMLAGHRALGITSDYMRRNPSMVADACAAIERHYFDQPDATGS